MSFISDKVKDMLVFIAKGVKRPGARWEAHHIVSADHQEAVGARLILAEDDIAIRKDDPDNGAWMPKTKADARQTLYPNAIGHNRIHRQLYYRWIENAISS
ncbi:MAG: AHH domain-containing protein [Pseudomonadales bacterium]|nr:AHH domain-containing protein [Pseudomonadales bacterium]